MPKIYILVLFPRLFTSFQRMQPWGKICCYCFFMEMEWIRKSTDNNANNPKEEKIKNSKKNTSLKITNHFSYVEPFLPNAFYNMHTYSSSTATFITVPSPVFSMSGTIASYNLSAANLWTASFG